MEKSVVKTLPERAFRRRQTVPASQGGEGGAHDERDGQQKRPKARMPAEGDEVGSQVPPCTGRRRVFDLPDRIEGVLELNDDAERGSEQ